MTKRADAGGTVSAAIVLAVLSALLAVAPLDAQSRRALADLGRFDPPAYAPPLVRDGEPLPVFDDAITAYGRKQYEQCANLLRRAVAVEPDDAAANAFLASALMMTDEVGEAEDRASVVLAAGETPFDSMARYVLAKASIRLGKLEVAERELTMLAGGSSQFAPEAAALLPRVKALKKK